MSDQSVRCEISNENMLKVYGISGLKVTSGLDKSLTIVLEKFSKYEAQYKKKHEGETL